MLNLEQKVKKTFHLQSSQQIPKNRWPKVNQKQGNNNLKLTFLLDQAYVQFLNYNTEMENILSKNYQVGLNKDH